MTCEQKRKPQKARIRRKEKQKTPRKNIKMRDREIAEKARDERAWMDTTGRS
uniref:Uncharacterized protein n=1 Tax=Nelumbo nucifera TaxID=4432 RepID=A0A822ZQS2_NELNU|nr:TPA_asm: hypothetical protein HUJ06_017174 [Nelumbo nucifera]